MADDAGADQTTVGPLLERSLLALRGQARPSGSALSADFAVIACNTARAVLPELRAKEILPILDVVVAACTEIPLVLESRPDLGLEIADPLEFAARAALAVAAGKREAEAAEA